MGGAPAGEVLGVSRPAEIGADDLRPPFGGLSLWRFLEAKNLGKTRSAKALHFTREQNSIEAAEAWLAANQSLPDLERSFKCFVAVSFSRGQAK